MPCPDCGAEGEPVLRRPRPYSPEAALNRGAFFGCPACGRRLSGLQGPAADRPSDDPRDQLPDPAGMVKEVIQPLVRNAARDERPKVMRRAVAELAGKHGLGFRAGDCVLLWRGEPWLKLGLEEGRVVIVPD